MLCDVNKRFVFKGLLTKPSNVLPLYLKQTFPHIIWIFTEGEGDGIKSRAPFKIFSTLSNSRRMFLKISHCALVTRDRKSFTRKSTHVLDRLSGIFRLIFDVLSLEFLFGTRTYFRTPVCRKASPKGKEISKRIFLKLLLKKQPKCFEGFLPQALKWVKSKK